MRVFMRPCTSSSSHLAATCFGCLLYVGALLPWLASRSLSTAASYMQSCGLAHCRVSSSSTTFYFFAGTASAHTEAIQLSWNTNSHMLHFHERKQRLLHPHAWLLAHKCATPRPLCCWRVKSPPVPLVLCCLQVACLVFGDESSAITAPVGYRGDHTLSMRSTKVCAGVRSWGIQPTVQAAVGRLVRCNMQGAVYSGHRPMVPSNSKSTISWQGVGLCRLPHCNIRERQDILGHSQISQCSVASLLCFCFFLVWCRLAWI